MKINLTKKQYEILIRAVDAGESVYGIIGDEVSEEYKRQSNEIEELRTYLLELAPEFGCGHMIEKFQGHTIMEDGLAEKLWEAIEEYDDVTFWDELETRLGKRDFYRSVTKDDEKYMEEHSCLPSRICGIYEKWGKEFEEYGVERLGVVEKE